MPAACPTPTCRGSDTLRRHHSAFRVLRQGVGDLEPWCLVGDEGVRGWTYARIVIERGERDSIPRRRFWMRSATGVPALNLLMTGEPQTRQKPRKPPGDDS